MSIRIIFFWILKITIFNKARACNATNEDLIPFDPLPAYFALPSTTSILFTSNDIFTSCWGCEGGDCYIES